MRTYSYTQPFFECRHIKAELTFNLSNVSELHVQVDCLFHTRLCLNTGPQWLYIPKEKSLTKQTGKIVIDCINFASQSSATQWWHRTVLLPSAISRKTSHPKSHHDHERNKCRKVGKVDGFKIQHYDLKKTRGDDCQSIAKTHGYCCPASRHPTSQCGILSFIRVRDQHILPGMWWHDACFHTATWWFTVLQAQSLRKPRHVARWENIIE
jgi:hypothetical protein